MRKAISMMLLIAVSSSAAQAKVNAVVTGQDTAREDQEAIRWHRLIVPQGDARAQYNLGVMCYRGEGVTQSYPEAVKWYRLAAAQGYELAKEALKYPDMAEAAKSGQ